MNGLDFFFLAIVGLSALWALLRGFVRELIALSGWIAAAYLATAFSGQMEVLLVQWVKMPLIAGYLASSVIFIAVLLVFAILGRIVKGWVGSRGLSMGDRIVGLVFGLVRGSLIVTLAIAVHLGMGGSTSRWTEESLVYTRGREGIKAAVKHLPKDSALGTRLRREGL